MFHTPFQGIIGSSFGTVVHTWGLKIKGPVYVALFRPLSIAIAAIMGVLFLGDTLYLGRYTTIGTEAPTCTLNDFLANLCFVSDLLPVFCSLLCSVIGAVFISLGFYIVLWGKAREETTEDLEAGSIESSETTPLLQ